VFQTSSQSYGSVTKPRADSYKQASSYSTSQSSSYAPYAPSSYKKDVTTFGVSKAMRTENNIGGDGEERFSVKVKQPPGGGSSFSLFGGPSEPTYKAPAYKAPAYQEPAYKAPAYKEPAYKAPAYQEPTFKAPSYKEPMYKATTYQEPTYIAPSYEEPAYQPPARKPAVASYEEPMYDAPSYPARAPPYSYDNYYEDAKAPSPAYKGAPGFSTSAALGKPRTIEPSSLNISSGPPRTFGQRVDSGMNSGPTTEKTSVRVHAPPGGKSSITF
jgi:hypothetical protein